MNHILRQALAVLTLGAARPLAAAAAVAFTANMAFAADLPTLKGAPNFVPPQAATNWTGCYAAAGGGYGLWTQTHDTLFPGGSSAAMTVDGGSGWLGRFGGGCDYQFRFYNSNFVIGLLGDYDLADLKGTNSPSKSYTASGITSTIAAYENETSAWSIGGRLGYLVTPDVLTFVDAGYTEARFHQDNDYQTNSAGVGYIPYAYPSHTYSGWFLGGGIETPVSGLLPGLPPGLFLRTEYRYAAYGWANLAEYNTNTGIADGNIQQARPNVQTATTSLIWRFGIPTPAAAAQDPDAGMITKGPPVPSAQNWTGCYAAAGAGYGFWTQTHDTLLSDGTSAATTVDGGSGWLGRFGGGCDYQFHVYHSNFLAGLLGDYDLADLKGTDEPSTLLTSSGISSPSAHYQNETGAWAIGGRLGYLLAPSVLSFVDAGYTQAHFNEDNQYQTYSGGVGYSPFLYPSHTYNGWFLGGGFETGLSTFLPSLPQGLFIRTEYRYATYGWANLAAYNTNTGVPNGNIEQTRPDVQTVTTSLIYRFNLPGF